MNVFKKSKLNFFFWEIKIHFSKNIIGKYSNIGEENQRFFNCVAKKIRGPGGGEKTYGTVYASGQIKVSYFMNEVD